MAVPVNFKQYKWLNLNKFDIECIPNDIERIHSLKLRKSCIKTLILPLLTNLPLHTGFKFSDANEYLSCKTMLCELFDEYHKRNYTKEEIIDIVNGKRVKKR